MKTLKLADGLSLPIDIVTQTMAILAKRRAGKSYTMRRLVEQLVKAGQQVVLVDPKGDQWGVRSAADGVSPGLPLVILGGEHADVPIESGSGEIVAKLVVEERVSAVLDLSLFRKHEVATFMTSFLENLYRLKAREIYRTPVMLVIDEADAIAPQKPQKGEERMLGAAEDIVRRGGQRGIGCVLVSQRSAVLNKNVLTQAQVLVVLRTIAPQDLVAMKAWIDVHGSDDEGAELMDSLPSLPVGDAWFWSPGWPTTDGIFKRVHVSPIETFDSGATPKPGEKRVEPKTVADIDLDALKRQMASTIAKAKADDPRVLRKQISTLERELSAARKAPAVTPQNSGDPRKGEKRGDLKQQLARQQRALDAAMKILVKIMAVDFPVKTEEDRKALEQAIVAAVLQVTGPIEKRVTALVSRVEGIRTEAARAQRAIAALLDEKIDLTVQVEKRAPFEVSTAKARPAAMTPRASSIAADASTLTPARQKVLNALAFLHGIGVAAADKTQLALFVGVSPTSGGYFNNLGALRTGGLIEYPSGGTVALTVEGQQFAVADGVPGSTRELHDAIRAKLPPAKWKILETLIKVYPARLGKNDLAAKIGVSPTSGGYFNNLGSLRTLGLLDYPEPGAVVALPVLFLEH